MYMEWPPGSVGFGYVIKENRRKQCIQLLGSLYGNVNAALRFYNLYAKYLITMGFIRSKTAPCLFILKNDQGEMIMLASCHVNDTQITGEIAELENFMCNLKKRFNIKDLGKMKKHLGVSYSWEHDKIGPKVVI